MKKLVDGRPVVVDIVCKIALVTAEKQLLVVRRSDTATYRPLMWDLPGGRWDGEEEELRATVVRELKEELGMTLSEEAISISLAIPVHHEGRYTVAIGFSAVVEKFSPRLSYEHDRFEWITRAQLETYPLVPAWDALAKNLI